LILWWEYRSPVPLFTSGAQAAAHGLAGIGRPGDAALDLMGEISHVRPDLRVQRGPRC
jgi:hypothetical protein